MPAPFSAALEASMARALRQQVVSLAILGPPPPTRRPDELDEVMRAIAVLERFGVDCSDLKLDRRK